MKTPPNFRPLSDEWRTQLLQIAVDHDTNQDPAHDMEHVRRVAALAQTLGDAEGGCPEIVVPAALLHELISLPKNHPDARQSGPLSADKAAALLAQMHCPPPQTDAIAACIRDHAYSHGVRPPQLNARILQDADRLDALGAVGIARCFSVGAAMGRPFYHPQDPFCRHRAPDDKVWTLDHFFAKLLRLPETLHTQTARTLAESRLLAMQTYLEHFAEELSQP